MTKLTPKQQRFIDEYLLDLNATQAAIRAGYSHKTANRIATENLSKPVIKAEIDRRRSEMQQKLHITQEDIVKQLHSIGFANLSPAELEFKDKLKALDMLIRLLGYDKAGDKEAIDKLDKILEKIT